MAEPNSQNVKPFFQTLNDKKSNQLYSTTDKLDLSNKNKHKGNTHYTDEEGKKYPLGYTPPVAFISYPQDKDSRGLPKELGVEITNDSDSQTTLDIQNDILDSYRYFKDQPGYDFLHNLDDVLKGSVNKLYLTSFVENKTDNQDPTMFGFDIIIDLPHSPLFNGGVEEFINSGLFNTYAEINSRLGLITEFKKQFFKFFRVNTPNYAKQNSVPRTFYLQKLTGLGQLTENLFGDKPKQFVDYNKDVLTLTLNEDVTSNIGYLIALYKTLTYSKINGKKMIPDNLLRFDMEIVVSEIRKFERYYRKDSTVSFYPDALPKYKYKLYECQFIFDRFSHEDSIDMTQPVLVTGFDIKINYKFSTLNFEKIDDAPSTIAENDKLARKQKFVNNARINFNSDTDATGSYDSTNVGFYINKGSIEIVKDDQLLDYMYQQINIDQEQKRDYRSYSNIGYTGSYTSAIDALDKKSIKNRKSSLNKLLEKTKDNVISSANNSLQNAIYTIKQELYAFVPTNFVGGFTEDGWQYNIPAYYTNKVINTLRGSAQKTLQSVRADIYAVAEKYKMQFLNNINIGINQGTNLLNNALGRIPGAIDKMLTGNSAGINTKSKPNNIYGNSSATPIVYSGDYSALPDKGYQATPNYSGFSRDGFQYNLPVWNRNHGLRIVGAIRNNNTSR